MRRSDESVDPNPMGGFKHLNRLGFIRGAIINPRQNVGLAQWNDRGRVDIAAKVWRYTGEKWSRQSEELPLHRVIDLAILIARTKGYFSEAYRIPGLYMADNPRVDRLPMQGDAMTVEICTGNENIGEDIQLFADALARDDEMLSERLHLLANMLRSLGYGNRCGE